LESHFAGFFRIGFNDAADPVTFEIDREPVDIYTD